jgi:hypothetical protein
MQATISASKKGVEHYRNQGACIKECNIDGCEFSAMSWVGWHGKINTNMFNIYSCVLTQEAEVA